MLGLPGALPVFNEAALEAAVRLGLGLGCKINTNSQFARKHYFYPDSPKGYQISQYDQPICEGGKVPFFFEGEETTVELERIHIEEDAGKSTHMGSYSLVDLNRAGVPLCEIVSRPVLRSAAEASAYLKALRQIVRHLGVSDGDMEKGQLRCDANVSIRKFGTEKLGTRTELKNINSFRFVEDAINSEIARQSRVLDSGETVVQETRLWDPEKNQSFPMRSKEQAEDYRYFPDPDLPPLVLDAATLEAITNSLPLMPGALLKEFASRGISGDTADSLVADPGLADYFLKASDGQKPDIASHCANWMMTELVARLNRDSIDISETKIKPEYLRDLVLLVAEGSISGKQAKQVFDLVYKTGASPSEVVEREGLTQVSDPSTLLPIIEEIISANPKQAKQFRSGKTKIIGFFVGQVMKETGGSANPELVNKLLSDALNKN